MYAQVEKPKEKSRAVANSVSQSKRSAGQGFEFVDKRPEATTQRKLQVMVNNSPNVAAMRKTQEAPTNTHLWMRYNEWPL